MSGDSGDVEGDDCCAPPPPPRGRSGRLRRPDGLLSVSLATDVVTATTA